MNKNGQTKVTTRAGIVDGSYENGLYVFKGIPYAAPSVGKLRWLPPQPVKPWKGSRQTKGYGADCPQNLMKAAFAISNSEYTQNEDCLYLNIWSPGLDNARRPVMVWIHGGGFQRGSGSQAIFDGSILAKRGDVVIVTINYRLNVFGFLRLNEVTGGKIPSTGNEGLLDQIAALKWVRDNIEAFGGNPDNVTVFGESAGAISIGCLLAMPSARGLFHKAMLQSGVGTSVILADVAAQRGRKFIEIVGLDAGDDKALRALTTEQLLNADLGMTVSMAYVIGFQSLPLVPVIDGKTFPELPLNAVKSGSAADIVLLVGNNLNEAKLFSQRDADASKLDEVGLLKHCEHFATADYAPGLIDAYRKARAKRGESTRPIDILVAIMGDYTFRIPAVRLVEAQSLQNQLCYNYLFAWKTQVMGDMLEACHGLDIGLVFGTYTDKFHGSAAAASKMANSMQEAWLSFARNGDPSCETMGSWPAYGERRATMMICEKSYIEAAPYEEERRAWEAISTDLAWR